LRRDAERGVGRVEREVAGVARLVGVTIAEDE
jgi:hypothetical protein